jgi:hypothetical protein
MALAGINDLADAPFLANPKSWGSIGTYEHWLFELNPVCRGDIFRCLRGKFLV